MKDRTRYLRMTSESNYLEVETAETPTDGYVAMTEEETRSIFRLAVERNEWVEQGKYAFDQALKIGLSIEELLEEILNDD